MATSTPWRERLAAATAEARAIRDAERRQSFIAPLRDAILERCLSAAGGGASSWRSPPVMMVDEVNAWSDATFGEAWRQWLGGAIPTHMRAVWSLPRHIVDAVVASLHAERLRATLSRELDGERFILEVGGWSTEPEAQ